MNLNRKCQNPESAMSKAYSGYTPPLIPLREREWQRCRWWFSGAEAMTTAGEEGYGSSAWRRARTYPKRGLRWTDVVGTTFSRDGGWRSSSELWFPTRFRRSRSTVMVRRSSRTRLEEWEMSKSTRASGPSWGICGQLRRGTASRGLPGLAAVLG